MDVAGPCKEVGGLPSPTQTHPKASLQLALGSPQPVSLIPLTLAFASQTVKPQLLRPRLQVAALTSLAADTGVALVGPSGQKPSQQLFFFLGSKESGYLMAALE